MKRNPRKKLLIIGGAVGLIAGGLLLTAGLARVGERPAKLTWRDPESRFALMTFGYKVYGNPKVQFGRHYLSKLVFKNAGEHPITDFSISYKLDDYIAWTDPEELHEIPPGFNLVALYYPKLPAQVTKIRNATNATFRIKVLWKEEGRQHEESFARDIVLRGVNEISYCDLPESELRTPNTVLSWLDCFNASEFAVAMVTPNDPVVNLYTSEITRLAGGTIAGTGEGGAREIGRLCRITYEYMKATELRYTGDSGVPANFDNIGASVQTVRLRAMSFATTKDCALNWRFSGARSWSIWASTPLSSFGRAILTSSRIRSMRTCHFRRDSPLNARR